MTTLKKITYDDFTSDQRQASEMLLDWYGSGKPRFCLAGYAGTGKSTLISQLPTLLYQKTGKLPQIGYCAYTGKAAQVLNRKGIPASTIHSMIYDARVIFDEKTKKMVHEYSLKLTIPYDLIVVDEASMVNAEIYNDLMSFGIPVIYVGDSGQLPPVEGKFNLMDESNVNYTLNQIHRQAEKSNIIRLSVAIRNGDRIADHRMDDVCKMPWSKFNLEEMFNFRQIIAGKNLTRVGINKICRRVMKFPDSEPVARDTMIFLRNNHTAGVVNGQQIYVESVVKRKDGNYDITYRDLWNPKAKASSVLASWKMLNNPEPMGNLQLTKEEARMKELTYVDFSNCISVHKSQGDGWKSVLFLDDGLFYYDADMRRKLLYTAVTRAEERLTWVYGIPKAL